MRVGLMGGTFDPVHIGHLRVAEETVEALSLDRLFFIPSADPPHKPLETVTAFEHRLRMVRIAVEDNPLFAVSDVEGKLPGKSYTVATLREFRKTLPEETELFFIVGMDAFLELDTWWNHMEIFRLVRPVVLRRPGHTGEEVETFLRSKISPLYERNTSRERFVHPELFPVHYLRNTRIGTSSTKIRHFRATGKSLRYLVPPGVIDYIEANGLYRTTCSGPARKGNDHSHV